MVTRIERQYRQGYYSDHGLGREMQWYPEETGVVITRDSGEVDRIRVEGAQDTVRAVWYGHGYFLPLNLTRQTPWFKTHAEVVDYWTNRFIETFQLTDIQQSF